MSIPFKSSSIVALAIVSLLSCSKSSDNGADITGSWNWVSRDGGIVPMHETPASTGKNITLVLGAGHDYTITTNGVITSHGTYTLETRECMHDLKSKTWINFSSATDMDLMVESLTSNTLFVSDEAYDGKSSTFSR